MDRKCPICKGGIFLADAASVERRMARLCVTDRIFPGASCLGDSEYQAASSENELMVTSFSPFPPFTFSIATRYLYPHV